MDIVHALVTVSTKFLLIKLILTGGKYLSMLFWEIRKTKEIRNRLGRIKH